MKKIFFLLIAVVSVLSACTKASEDKEKPTTVNIGFLRVPNDEAIAKQMGYIDDFFKAQDIQVNYVIVDSGVDANKAFASGSLDFATMGNTNAIVALAKGLDTELVWIHEVLGSIEGLAVRKNSGIQKITDLKGKKVATTFSSTAHYILLNVLKENGIADDVEIIDMQTADIVAAWERKDIDAAYTWEPSLSNLLKSNGRILIDSADMAKKGLLTANVGVVRKSFAHAHPELVSGLLTALDKGSALFAQHREQAISAAARELEISPQTAADQMDGSIWLRMTEQLESSYLGTQAEPGTFVRVMKDTAEFLQAQGAINHAPSFEDFSVFMNSAYITQALQTQ